MTFYDRLESLDLQGADVSGVDLRWANMQHCCLDYADLTGASFRGVKGVSFLDELEDLKAQVEELTDDNYRLERSNSELSCERDELETKCENLADEVDDLRKEIRQLSVRKSGA
jgi:FtsZ-binding cell division protein ZapB